MAITQMHKANVKSAVKHMVRQIARISNPQRGYQTVDEVDAELSSLLLQGYRIMNTHSLGSQRDTEANIEYFGVMYILVLEQSEIEKLKAANKEREKVLDKEG